MIERLRSIFCFNTSAKDCNMEKVYAAILEDNRKFAVIWSLIQIVFWGYCFVMSFRVEEFIRCRNAYTFAIILSVIALAFAQTLAKKYRFMTIITALLIKISFIGASLLIARIQMLNQNSTIMIFAAALMTPILFVNYTPSNIIFALVEIIAAIILLHDGIDREALISCVSKLTVLSCLGVTIGHFVDKERFERFVFAESAVQLAELQKRYAYYDQMTGLQNRRAYTEKTDELANSEKGYIVVMADINGLKEANDTRGHDAGDALIRGSAECLKRSFEGEIYRIGGDEFSVIMDAGADVEKSLQILERETAAWKDQYVNGISISCGVAVSGESSDINEVLKAADKRMYAAKSEYYRRTGKDRRRR